MNRFANYLVKRRLCMWVVYQDGDGKRPKVVRFADGNPAIFASANDAFLWVIQRIAYHIGYAVRLTELQ